MKTLLKLADDSAPETYADPNEGPEKIKTDPGSNAEIHVPDHPSKSSSNKTLGSSDSDGIKGTISSGDGLNPHPTREINVKVTGGKDEARKRNKGNTPSDTQLIRSIVRDRKRKNRQKHG